MVSLLGMSTHDGSPEGLLNELARLLADNAIGLDRLAARPRGNRLPDETRGSIETVLDELDLVLPVSPTGDVAADRSSALVYGNGCFSVRRYEAASETYRSLLEADRSEARNQDRSLVCDRASYLAESLDAVGTAGGYQDHPGL